MKQIAVLNIHDATVVLVASSSSSPQVGNMFLPVPRMPQGILSLGVEEVVSTTNTNTTHLLFWAQSRAMQVFVYDLMKDILRMKNEEDDDEEFFKNDIKNNTNSPSNRVAGTTSSMKPPTQIVTNDNSSLDEDEDDEEEEINEAILVACLKFSLFAFGIN